MQSTFSGAHYLLIGTAQVDWKLVENMELEKYPEDEIKRKLAEWIDSSVLADIIVDILAEYNEMEPEFEEENLQEAKDIYLKLLEVIPGEVEFILKYKRR